MNSAKRTLAGSIIVVVAMGAIAQVQAANRPHGLAAPHSAPVMPQRPHGRSRRALGTGGITVPGRIADLPQLPPDITVTALPLPQTPLSACQALDAAEAWSRSTDTDVDPTTRAVPVILNYGLAPADQHLKAWIVTINRDMTSQGPAGSPRAVLHKLCIAVDATTGAFIVAFGAGQGTLLP